MSTETAPLLGGNPPRSRRGPSGRHSRATSIEEAWSEPEDGEVGEPEDYSSIIFNLHVWSYRLSQQEFAKYERRVQLQHAAATFDPRRFSLLFWPRFSAASPAAPAVAGTHQRHQQRDAEVGGYSSTSASTRPRRYIGFSSDSRSYSGFAAADPKKPKPKTCLGLPVLPVNHPFMAAWSVLMLLVDMVYTAILLPLMFAFDLLHPNQDAFWLSVAMGCLYFADMLLVLHRGVVIRYLHRHIYIDNPWDVATLYIRHGPFLADLPVALSGPLQLLELIPSVRGAGPQEGGSISLVVNTFLLLRGLRLVKLLLLSRELFFGKMGFRHMGRSVYRWYSLSLVYVLGVLINWLACIMLGIAQHEGLENSWLADVKGQDLTSAPPSRQYVAAFYWMLISTLTIGYGDISAVTTLEQCAVVCAVLTGVLFIGYAIKCITDIMVEQAVQDEDTQRLSTLRQRAGELKLWATWQDLPQELVDPMFRYFMGPWLTKQVVKRHWGNVLEDLPAQLRGQVLANLLLDKHKELSPLGSRLLCGIRRQACWHVLALLQPVVLAPGQQLCWKGQPAECLWLMQEGSVVPLDGVVPNEDAIVEMPGMLLAFDVAAWVAQQRACCQQQQQQQQRGKGSSPDAAGQAGSAGRGGGAQHAPVAFTAPDQAQPQILAETGAAAEDGSRYHSLTSGATSLNPSLKPSPSPSPSSSMGASPTPPNAQDTACQVSAEAAALKYTVSYQAVSSSFFWALPLHQLGLAFCGLPRLKDNFEAEVLGSMAPTAAGRA